NFTRHGKPTARMSQNASIKIRPGQNKATGCLQCKHRIPAEYVQILKTTPGFLFTLFTRETQENADGQQDTVRKPKPSPRETCTEHLYSGRSKAACRPVCDADLSRTRELKATCHISTDRLKLKKENVLGRPKV
ncbi:unnamed protein product, partial [Ectocarpus sp. 13 AM-2016]